MQPRTSSSSLGWALAIAFVVAALAGPVAAQLSASTRVATQTSISVSCNEPSCDCFVNGSPHLCPGSDVQNFDSGNAAGPSSHVYAPFVSGQFVGFDAHSDVDASVDGSSTFGTLHSYSSGSATAGGAYVLAGGLAIPATSNGFTSTSFTDYLTITGLVPGQPVAVAFTQVVSAFTLMSVGSGSGVNPCLANAAATVQLNATSQALNLSNSDSGMTQFGRFGRLGGVDGGCVALRDTGTPISAFTLNLHVGDVVNVAQILDVTARVRMDGGLGAPTNPNRVLNGDAVIDASNSAKLYVDVLTPGASYTSLSGAAYRAPEPVGTAGLAAALVVLSSLAIRRRARCAA